MNEVVQEILKWPVIVQGALGSGVFWVILFLGQKIVLFLSGRLSRYSTKKRIGSLRIESLKYKITLNNQPHRASFIGILLYKAVGRTTLGLVWLTLGLAFQSIIPVFGLIGFVGALYHFFNAWQIFRPLDTEVDREGRINEIAQEISELEKHNKQMQPTPDASAD